MASGTRTESDSLGDVQVPADALYGAQTQRAVDNFPLSGRRMPDAFIVAVCQVKAAAARVNADLGLLEQPLAQAIQLACDQVLAGDLPGGFARQFPVDVFQTGSGTSTNMNVNEVLAHLASANCSAPVHPNDHVNMGQSSNDVIPTAIHLAAASALQQSLLPALEHLQQVISLRAASLETVAKTGRTHLMDAMPLTFAQELSGWAAQVQQGRDRLLACQPRLHQLALGGTAIGTGINAHPDFADAVVARLAEDTGLDLRGADNRFAALASQDTAVELSGTLKTLAVALLKICNDLRWMNSGPQAGLNEIELPALQPGSSIMPGKVNPVIPEAVAMLAAEVIGNDSTITIAGQSGNFQLNVMLPVVAWNLLQSISLLANGSTTLADRAIAGFAVRHDQIEGPLARNPVLVTALNPVIGYAKAAAVAKAAYRSGRPVLEVAVAMTDLGAEQLAKLLDPLALTKGGLPDQD